MNKIKLIDNFWTLNRSKKAFTRIQANPYTTTRLLFFILISSNLCCNVKSNDTRPSIMLDHSIVFIKLNVTHYQTGTSSLKINNRVLLDHNFVLLSKRVTSDLQNNNSRTVFSSSAIGDV